jgi:hypothetical protein
MADAKKSNPAECKTPRALGCYVTLAKPRPQEVGKDPEYSIALLWPKTTNIDVVRKAIEAAAIAKFGPNAPKLLGTKLKTPLKDGNLKTDDAGDVDPNYKDKWTVNAKSKQRVTILDPQMQVVAPEDVFSGCYFHASLRFYGYEWKPPSGGASSRGVGCGLQGLMLVGKGPRIDGRVSAEAAFRDFTPDVMEDTMGDSADDLLG